MKEGKTALVVHTPALNGYDCALHKIKKNCILWANSDRVLLGGGDSGGPIYCDVNGRMKQFGVASFAAQMKSTDVNKSYHGYAPVFTPDAQRHLQKWNPNNRVPADFPGTNELLKQYKSNPGSIKMAPGGPAPSGRSSSSQNYGSSQQSRSPSRYGSSSSQQFGSSRQSGSSQQSRSPSRYGSSQQTGSSGQPASSCAELKYCNGKGHCGRTRTGVKCYCNSGYSGRDCSQKAGGSSSQQPQGRSQPRQGHQSQQSAFGNNQGSGYIIDIKFSFVKA